MKEMKRTATVTWLKYYNFGTYLQAYALQQIIISMGYKNHILYDINVMKPKRTLRTWCKIFMYNLLPDFIKGMINPFTIVKKKSDKLYEEFLAKYLTVDFTTANNKEIATKLYDIVVCGSDQIWCPLNYEHLIGHYYADFFSGKKISYASSFGTNEYPERLKGEFLKLVSPFEAISCREKIGVEFIKDIMNRKALHVVDPTLLLSGDEWRKIANTNIVFHERYLLVYFLSPNQWYLDYSREYARHHGLKLITFYLRSSSQQEADETVIAGPSEFVGLIDKAEMLFTDSFHGSILATLMSTPFVGFKRFTGIRSGQNHRMTDLYAKMDISERFILDADDCSRIEALKPQDFDSMRYALQHNINQSMDFLRKSLDNSSQVGSCSY